ncbi:MAG: hypothetical protein ACQKBT_12835, partial [Puniceicoccales bacterium]
DQSASGGNGWSGDCLQLRMIFDYEGPNEQVSHWTCWQDPRGENAVRLDLDRDFKGRDRTDDVKQAYYVLPDGKHYNQELALPWRILTKDGKAPKVGTQFRLTVEPNFTAGPLGRISIKDLLYSESGTPNRIFTFRAYKDWGNGVITDEVTVEPQPLILANSMELEVTMEDGEPVINWSKLDQENQKEAHLEIPFEMPIDGEVSMILKDQDGNIVRHLLGGVPFGKGEHIATWDGLTMPYGQEPGDVLPAGEYTWSAIAHEPFSLTLRGWANSHGLPWNDGPQTQWGGDHGKPRAVARNGDQMLLGWSGAEAGTSTISVDLEGNTQWKISRGMGHYMHKLDVANDRVVAIGWNQFWGREVMLMDAEDGLFDRWENVGKSFFTIDQLWSQEGSPVEEGLAMPLGVDTMSAHGDVVYLGFSEPWLRAPMITDWKAVAEWLLSDDPLAQKVREDNRGLDQRRLNRLKNFVEGKTTEQKAFGRAGLKGQIPMALAKEMHGEAVVYEWNDPLEFEEEVGPSENVSRSRLKANQRRQ